MRIRTIKPEFWDSESVGALSFGARLLFIATWNLADDEGRLRWNCNLLNGHAFTYDNVPTEQVQKWMNELVDGDFVVSFEAGDKVKSTYAVIVNWNRHQKIDRPQPSKLPAPPPELLRSLKRMANNSTNDSVSNSTNHSLLEGKGRERKGMEQGVEIFAHTNLSWQEIKSSMRESELIPISLERREKIPRDKVPDLLESFFLRCESTGHDRNRSFRDVATHFDAWVSKHWKEHAGSIPVNQLKTERTM